jgi:hypothetical protein
VKKKNNNFLSDLTTAIDFYDKVIGVMTEEEQKLVGNSHYERVIRAVRELIASNIVQPKITRWKCLHCGHNNRFRYDHFYTRILWKIPHSFKCSKCYGSTVCKMIKPGLYEPIRKT